VTNGLVLMLPLGLLHAVARVQAAPPRRGSFAYLMGNTTAGGLHTGGGHTGGGLPTGGNTGGGLPTGGAFNTGGESGGAPPHHTGGGADGSNAGGGPPLPPFPPRYLAGASAELHAQLLTRSPLFESLKVIL